jgi:hypothetical protein
MKTWDKVYLAERAIVWACVVGIVIALFWGWR